eukprot:CAMPEP_0115308988 /NCGR_PEP_ID=MMETSP0270-20121206/73999_1 /TAXON_ID=71861 /ORGANISM="Scrippsiella trochoidea, Strain CCMP3099" /LENGTH=75 /DNA_ID=CAMNT_0002727597 /DNA_START=277 /DNA_END=504 /DNA_ORIENTATION=+
MSVVHGSMRSSSVVPEEIGIFSNPSRARLVLGWKSGFESQAREIPSSSTLLDVVSSSKRGFALDEQQPTLAPIQE